MENSQTHNSISKHYQDYDYQKCFIAFTENVEWADDLLNACTEVLVRPQFKMVPDYAGKHLKLDVPLRQKALELIANARYGIYDLSYRRRDDDSWQIPRNVFIELGMAIALNRPTLLLRHSNNKEIELPECLKSLSHNILEFSGESTLKRALEKHLPQWIDTLPEDYWWNRFCIFGGRKCEYREAHPRAKQWGAKKLCCHLSDGDDPDRSDFRTVVEDVLGRFSDITYRYLDALSTSKGYEYLLCSHCQVIRSTPFAIYRISPNTPPETFIAIGISTALELQFEYTLPKLILTENLQDVPSLLSGYEVVVAKSDSQRKAYLSKFLPSVIQTVRETSWKPRPLPFIDITSITCLRSNDTLDHQTRQFPDNVFELLSKRVGELELTVRAYNCLRNAEIETVGDLVQKSETELEAIKDWAGRKTTLEIKNVLSEMGLHLNMDLSGLHIPAGPRASISREHPLLSRKVDELEISVRTYHCLKNANITTIGELVENTETELLQTKLFGKKSINELKEVLNAMGLDFGMDPSMLGINSNEAELSGGVGLPIPATSRSAKKMGRSNEAELSGGVGLPFPPAPRPAKKTVRLYELAKELKVDTKLIIEAARREGVDVSGPSNSVPNEVADRMRSWLKLTKGSYSSSNRGTDPTSRVRSTSKKPDERVNLIRHLIKHGCELSREGGKHSIYVNKDAGTMSAVPRHNEISTFTANKICRDLKIPLIPFTS